MMIKPTVIALILLGPLSTAAFSSPDARSKPLRSISSSTPLFVSNASSGDLSSKDDTAKFHAETAKIEKQSQNWILRTVVGLNLCPFAFPSLKNHKVKLIVVRGTDDNEIAQAVVEELMMQTESLSGENSIVVAPDYYPDDFRGYMRMVQFLEEGPMNQFDLHNYVQIAPFHPHFVFDFKELDEERGEKKSSPIIDNYVNRSPYPMFHVLKTDDVEHAVATACGGDPGKVTRRNAKLLRKFETVLGKEGATDLLLSFATQEETSEYPTEMVDQVMNEIRRDDDDGPVEGMVRGSWEL